MKKRNHGLRDVDLCVYKIKRILKEYNCEIYLDDEFGIGVTDIDNKESAWPVTKFINNQNFETS